MKCVVPIPAAGGFAESWESFEICVGVSRRRRLKWTAQRQGVIFRDVGIPDVGIPHFPV